MIYMLKRSVWLSRKWTEMGGCRRRNSLRLEGRYLVIRARADGGLDYRSGFPNLGTNDI